MYHHHHGTTDEQRQAFDTVLATTDEFSETQ
jgi:hypothetical protein